MKKKVASSKLKGDKEAAEALVSRGREESDVEEDQEVADLSSIPTPQIGFKMPKLRGEKTDEKEKTKKKKPLTANLLNNQIVNMRAAVEKAKFYLANQLQRKIKFIEKMNAKKDNKKEEKHVGKMNEEVAAMKTIGNDEVAKFALLNKKPKNELKLDANTPVAERCLYHLATSKPVQKEVNKFRETFADWEVRTAYFLQRLGQQYRETKEDKKTKDDKTGKVEKTDESGEKEGVDDEKEEEEDEDEESGEEADDEEVGEEGDGDGEEGEVSDVEMGSGSEDEETIANRRNLLLGLCGIKEDRSRPKIAPKPLKRHAQSDDDDDEEPAATSVVRDVLKKKIESEAAKTKSQQKKLAAELKGEKEKPVKRQNKKEVEEAAEADGPVSQAVVKKIKLSEGGVVQLEKRTQVAAGATVEEEEEESSGDEGGMSFFLNPTALTGGASSGEESVDDETDFKAAPMRGKQPREMPKGRIRLQEKLERRTDERKQKLQKQRQAAFEGKGKKTAPNPKEPETLHPSWAARVQKKKQLENVQPQGKRVVFDEGD